MGFDGSRVRVREETMASVCLAGKTVSVPVLRAHSILPGVDMIVGMDVLKLFHVVMDKGKFSVVADPDRDVELVGSASGSLRVQGRNFIAWFRGG